MVNRTIYFVKTALGGWRDLGISENIVVHKSTFTYRYNSNQKSTLLNLIHLCLNLIARKSMHQFNRFPYFPNSLLAVTCFADMNLCIPKSANVFSSQKIEEKKFEKSQVPTPNSMLNKKQRKTPKGGENQLTTGVSNS